MDSKYLIVGIFVVLLLVTALQAYQLSAMNAKINANSGSSQISLAPSTVSSQAAQSSNNQLPGQVGGC